MCAICSAAKMVRPITEVNVLFFWVAIPLQRRFRYLVLERAKPPPFAAQRILASPDRLIIYRRTVGSRTAIQNRSIASTIAASASAPPGFVMNPFA